MAFFLLPVGGGIDILVADLDPRTAVLLLSRGGLLARAFNMCGDFATPNLYAVSQQNCLQALYTRMTVMCRRSGSSSSNDDVERAAI